MSDPIDRPFLQPLEPTAQQEGLDAPGFYSATSDFINGGVYNGTFRIGPPQTASNLDVASSLTGSNFLPGWRFVQSSNTAITASHVRNTEAPGGSNLRFTFASGAANDEAYIEQLVDLTGSAVSTWESFRVTFQNGSLANTKVMLDVDILTADGLQAREDNYFTSSTATNESSALSASEKGTITARAFPAPFAKYAKVRVRIKRGTASTAGTGTLDLLEVKRDKVSTQLALVDSSSTDFTAAYSYQKEGAVYFDPGVKISSATGGSDGSGSGSIIFPRGIQLLAGDSYNYAPYSGGFDLATNGLTTVHATQKSSINYTITNSAGGSNLLVGWAMMAITASNNNTPANVTEALSIPNPASSAVSIRFPFPAHVVGLSLRKAGAVHTGGTAEIELTKNGNILIDNAYTFTTTNEANYAVAYTVGQYEYSAQDVFQIRVNTSAAWAPTTQDLTAVIYLMVPLGSFL